MKQYFDDLIFDKERHRYYTPDLPFLYSATTIVSYFHEKFDSQGIAKEYSEKRLEEDPTLTKEVVLSMWDHIRDTAAAAGTQLHEFAENIGTPNISGEYSLSEAACFYRIHNYLNTKTPKEKEFMMYDPETLLCGTTDAIFDFSSYLIDVEDWKSTNPKSYDVPFMGRKMYYPFHDIDDCPLGHYTVHLNIYRYIIEKRTPYKVNDMAILMLKIDNGLKMPFRITLPRISDDVIKEAAMIFHNRIDPVTLQPKKDNYSNYGVW